MVKGAEHQLNLSHKRFIIFYLSTQNIRASSKFYLSFPPTEWALRWTSSVEKLFGLCYVVTFKPEKKERHLGFNSCFWLSLEAVPNMSILSSSFFCPASVHANVFTLEKFVAISFPELSIELTLIINFAVK